MGCRYALAVDVTGLGTGDFLSHQVVLNVATDLTLMLLVAYDTGNLHVRKSSSHLYLPLTLMRLVANFAVTEMIQKKLKYD